jgi:hypothetical protein
VPIYWLSFRDPDLPEGSQFLGAAIVEAQTFRLALARSWTLGYNPGGEIAVHIVDPKNEDAVADLPRDQLLSREQAEALLEKFKEHPHD